MSENTDKIKAYLSEKGYSSKLTNEQMDYLAGSPDRLAYFESKLAERERKAQLNTVKDYLLNSYYAPDLNRETFKQLLSDPSKIEQYENNLASDKSHLGENIRIGAVNTLRDLGIASSALFGDNESVSELNRRKTNDAQLSEILQRTKGGEIAGVPTNQLIQSVTNFAATLPLSFIPGVGQAVYLGEKAAESFGSSYGEAYEQTGDAASAWGYALPNAAVQTAIESIGGVGSKAGLTTVRNMGESALKNTLKSVLKSGIDEGLEEIYGTAADTALKQITGLDPDAQIELKDLWTGFFTGSLLGAVAGGGTAAVNNGISASRYNKLTDIQKVFADAAYKADALPELSQAKQVAREYSRLAAEGNPVEPEAILQLNKLLNDDLVKYGLMEQKDVDSWQAKHEKMFKGYQEQHTVSEYSDYADAKEYSSKSTHNAEDISSYIDLNRARESSPEMKNVIDEYEISIDPSLKSLAQQYMSNKDMPNTTYIVSNIGEREIRDLNKLSGADFNNYTHNIDKSAFDHIRNRHGVSGKADKSMSNINDIARIPYVLSHYDTIEYLTDMKGAIRTSRNFKGSDNKPSPLIRYSKRIDGTVYVVEAVAENKNKRLNIVSAYITKNKKGRQDPDGNTPRDNARNEPTLPSENIISLTNQNVNSGNVDNATQRDQSSPRYRQSPERWTATLDSNNREAVEDVGDIVRDISRSFNLPINTGKVGHINANGVYKVKDEAVRVQVTNALPTISHELGHHLDKQYGLSKLKSIQTAVNMMDPNFAAQYKPAEQGGEAVAEFIRSYLSSRGQAAINYRDFYFDAIEAIRKGPNGEQALEDLNRIARKVNAYMSADLPLRYARGLKSRLDPEHMPVSDRLEKFRVNFQSKWVDSYSYLKRVDGAAQDGGYTGDMTTYKAALYSLNAASTVESMLFNGVSDYQGNIVGESLSQALEKIKPQDMESFNLYLRDRHALEVVSNDKRVFADDKLNDPEALKRQIQRYEKRYPEFVEAAGRVYEYQRNVLWYHGVKNGLISEELYNKLQSMYPDYVPFYRYIEGKTPRAGKKAGFVNQRAPIKKLKGSGAEIYDPIENIVMQTNMLVSASMKNAVLQQLAKEYDSADSMGLFMEQVTPDMARRSVSTQGAINKLADRFAGENFSKEDAKAVFEDILGDTIVEYAVSPFQDQNIVRVMQNGQARYFRINDAELLNALTALSPKQLSEVIEFLGKMTRAFKTFTTGLNPFFANSNFFRDFATGWKYSQAGLLEYSKNLLSAFNDIRKKSEAYKQYQAAGGLYSGDVARPKQLKDVLTRMYKQNPVQVERGFKKVVALAHMGFSKMDDLIGAVETAPRLAEFKRKRAGGASNIDAVLEAADLTVNFKLSGTEGRVLNQIIPYFNAAVQGLYKLSRVMTDANKRKSFLIKSTLSAAILATIQLALVWLNDEEEEYKTLSTYNKNNFFCFSIGNGKFIKIPKARELAWLNSLVERTAEAVFMENSDAFYNFGEYTAQMFLPPGLPTEFNNIETILTAPVRDSIIGSFVELAINEDFKGSPIVPSSMENLEDRLQYDESTTAIAKYIGDFFNISPKQLDHLFSNYFGGLHRALAAVTADSKDWSFGLGRQFIADSAYSNDVVTRFYDERNSWTVKATSYPDNAEYAMQKYRHQSMSAILSELNGIARESDAQTARDIKFNTAALLQEFMSTDAYMTDELMEIYEEVLKKDGSRDNDILPFIRPKAEITLPGDKKAVLSYEDYIELYVQASQEIYAEYDSILSGSGNSESKAKRLKKAKESILERVTDEYVQEYMGKEG